MARNNKTKRETVHVINSNIVVTSPKNTYKKDLKISKVVEVDVKIKFIHFDELADGTWQITYSKGELL
jgi:hypothetical protein